MRAHNVMPRNGPGNYTKRDSLEFNPAICEPSFQLWPDFLRQSACVLIRVTVAYEIGNCFVRFSGRFQNKE